MPHFEHCENCRRMALRISKLAQDNENLSDLVNRHKTHLIQKIMDGKAAEHGYGGGDDKHLIYKGKAAHEVYMLAVKDQEALLKSKVKLTELMQAALTATNCDGDD